MSDHTLGDAAKEHVRQSLPPVRAHDDQIDLLFARDVLDNLGRHADPGLDSDGKLRSFFGRQRRFRRSLVVRRNLSPISADAAT